MKQLFVLLTLLLLISCQSNLNKSARVSDSTSSFYKKPDGIWFNVSDVKQPDSLLKVDTAKNVFQDKIGKEILFYPEKYKNYVLVNCPNNGLIQTIQECYDSHRPLIITPDVIWLAICQGVSIHINQKFDSLKNIIFVKDKPERIKFRNDSLEYNGKQWTKLISLFSSETKKYTKEDFYSFFVSEFSTTTEINKAVYQITLLESYKKAFQYVGETGCGIPSITITGTREDWQTMLSKLDMLHKIGLSNWYENLRPIISEFVNVFDKKINKDFWKSMYKCSAEYNAFYISGWILKFFPYIKELKRGGEYDKVKDAMKVGEIYEPNPFLDGNNFMRSTLSTDNFPSGISKINVTWNNYIKNFTKNIEIYAGFFAIKQYPDKTLEPFISWVISDKNGRKNKKDGNQNKNYRMGSGDEFWSPHICEKVTDSAIYDSKHYKTQSASVDFVRLKLLDSLSNNLQLKNIDLSNDTLEFIVYLNGAIGEFKLLGNSNTELLKYIQKQMLNLPENWFPALAHPYDILFLMGDINDDQIKGKVKVNSMVRIALRR